MRTFTDNLGRSWSIVIHVAAMKRVKGMCGIDLYKLVDNKMVGLHELLNNPVEFVDVLWCLCEPQAKERSITDEQFGEAISGDTIEGAIHAFLDEYTDFFPNPRVRAGLKKVKETSLAITNRLMDLAEAEMATIDVDREVSELIKSFGVLPESSGSTPARSLSENST